MAPPSPNAAKNANNSSSSAQAGSSQKALPPILELFFDPEFKKPVDKLVFDVTPLGGKQTKTFYTKNFNYFPVYPQPRPILDKDFRIVRYPNALKASEVGSVEVEFTPSPTRREPFQDVEWGFDVLF